MEGTFPAGPRSARRTRLVDPGRSRPWRRPGARTTSARPRRASSGRSAKTPTRTSATSPTPSSRQPNCYDSPRAEGRGGPDAGRQARTGQGAAGDPRGDHQHAGRARRPGRARRGRQARQRPRGRPPRPGLPRPGQGRPARGRDGPGPGHDRRRAGRLPDRRHRRPRRPEGDDPRITQMLVAGMQHDDPATRLASLKSLRKITGKDLGVDAARLAERPRQGRRPPGGDGLAATPPAGRGPGAATPAYPPRPPAAAGDPDRAEPDADRSTTPADGRADPAPESRPSPAPPAGVGIGSYPARNPNLPRPPRRADRHDGRRRPAAWHGRIGPRRAIMTPRANSARPRRVARRGRGAGRSGSRVGRPRGHGHAHAGTAGVRQDPRPGRRAGGLLAGQGRGAADGAEPRPGRDPRPPGADDRDGRGPLRRPHPPVRRPARHPARTSAAPRSARRSRPRNWPRRSRRSAPSATSTSGSAGSATSSPGSAR